MRPLFDHISGSLDSFSLSIFRFDLKALQPLTAPFSAIPLRGAFGYALLAECCPYDDNRCGVCDRAPECAYASLFDATPPPDSPVSGKFSSAPRPYIIAPAEGAGSRIPAGGSFSFTVTLIGTAVAYLPAVAAAFTGLGRSAGIGPGRARFDLERVVQYVPGDEVVILERGVSHSPAPPFSFGLIPPSHGIRQATVNFETPLDIQIKGTPLIGAPPFSLLIETLLNRALLLNHFHCGAGYLEPDGDIIAAAANVSTAQAEMKRAEHRRHSTRQDRPYSKGGWLGSVTYVGNLSPFMPLLRLGELIGVGRSTTFGLGRYIVEA